DRRMSEERPKKHRRNYEAEKDRIRRGQEVQREDKTFGTETYFVNNYDYLFFSEESSADKSVSLLMKRSEVITPLTPANEKAVLFQLFLFNIL
ncbi:MAG: hypothetical protein K2I11_08635, partial [Bacteroides sp.]|nr:hypothetical protein [Bacteroides sp.]